MGLVRIRSVAFAMKCRVMQWRLPPIPPGSLLKFDVELLSVAPPAAPQGTPGGAGPNIGSGTGR